MRYAICNQRLTVTVDDHGAELRSIVGQDGVNYLCPEDKLNWERCSPVLFPNTGVVKEDYVLIDGQRYPFVKHGFAQDSTFEAEEHQPDLLVFTLRSNERTRRMYPFAFVLRITYKLEGDSLVVTSQVENQGDKPMPFSLGFHPSFTCPLMPDEQATDYQLTFPGPMTAARLTIKEAMIDQRVEGFWDGITEIPVQEGMFDGGSFAMTNLTQRSVRLQSRRSGRGIELNLGDYPNLVLWAPKHLLLVQICIEPWYGMPDALNTDHVLMKKHYTLIVESHRDKKLAFSVRFY